MNKQLWKLDKIGDRLWLVATDAAQQAASLGLMGRGMAVVADEARRMAINIEGLTERAMFEDDNIDEEKLMAFAVQLEYLAFNSAIEAFRLKLNGKAAAVCADEIRSLATDTIGLFRATDKKLYHPRPKTCLTSVSQPQEFLSFTVNGAVISENLDNIQEIIWQDVRDRTETHISFRQHTLPLCNTHRLIGKSKEKSSYVILKTQWAEQNKTYAVAFDELLCLYFSPVGKPSEPPKDIPLAPYIREYWESEDGEPYLFMDWPKIAAVSMR